jgi:hypothetical protein
MATSFLRYRIALNAIAFLGAYLHREALTGERWGSAVSIYERVDRQVS